MHREHHCHLILNNTGIFDTCSKAEQVHERPINIQSERDKTKREIMMRGLFQLNLRDSMGG